MIDFGQMDRERTVHKEPYLAVGISWGKDICVHLESVSFVPFHEVPRASVLKVRLAVEGLKKAVRKQRGPRKKVRRQFGKPPKWKITRTGAACPRHEKDATCENNEPGDNRNVAQTNALTKW